MEIFDEYSRKARLFPAILCSVPFLLIKIVVIDKFIDPALTAKFLSAVVGGVAIWMVLVYLIIQVNRFISKSLFEDKSKFHTHIVLAPGNTGISQNMRDKIAKQVEKDFKIKFPTISESSNEPVETKSRIHEITGLIIHKVGKGKLLFQHNVEYGFARNLAGGSMVAAIVALFNVALFYFILKNHSALIVSVILFVLYLIPVIFSKIILRHFSKEYSDILFREYIGKN